MRIREFREQEAPAVGTLIADTFGKFNLSHLSPAARDRFLGPFRHARSGDAAHQKAIAETIRAHWVFVAEDDGEIVGVLRGKPGKIQSLFVREDRHRQGIGRALVGRYESACVEAGTAIVRLQATLYAVPFYQRVGYVRSTGVRAGRIFEGAGFEYQPMRKVLVSR